ncbi:hypothetical protein G6O69_10665 [Pseudenhygromyxa sp. WMMC2535]|uniref:TlpA family protein disulfide reductase n=1 Tax=Pseudenhygromyxa sp. WMMC2535 TaxID=2712867 RepID=UPI0015549307|nr:hypothetical protein [Pseudenhygromyxa sp. WMMC2535]NVB38294.1 hypothetical protein [Pseudenhygromyxa sp. WMMC2535]
MRRFTCISFVIPSLVLLTACPSDDGGGNDDGNEDGTDDGNEDEGTGAETSAGESDTSSESTSAGTGETGVGETDSGETDVGETDVGETDTGETDTGETDTGVVDCENDPGWGALEVGAPVKYITALDQNGEEVSFCQWLGTPIALDVAAVWCGPCNEVSSYFSSDSTDDPFGGGLGEDLRTMINGGKVIWATALVQDASGQATTVENAAAWDAQYPNENIPVMVEGDVPMVPDYVQLGCWPSVFVVDHELNWLALDDCATWNHLFELTDNYGE